MSKHKAVCVTALVLSTVAFGAPKGSTGRLTAKEVFRRASPSVLMVRVFDAQNVNISLGSGVVIAEGIAATNFHVVEGGLRFQVDSGSQRRPAHLLYCESFSDLCLLSVPGLEARPVVQRTLADVKIGERVYAIGAPEGLALTLSEGLVSGIRASGESKFLQTSAPISHGSSGGGLFDDRGRLIGLTTASLESGQNLNFAISADILRSFLNRAGLNSLVEKYLIAKGGRDALTSLTSLRLEGRALVADQVFPVAIEWKRPDLYRMDMWIGSVARTHAYDGLQVWSRDSNGLRFDKDVSPEDRWMTLDSAKHFLDPIDFDGRSAVEFLGLRTLRGRQTFLLRLKEEGGGDTLINLDCESFREVRMVRNHIINGRQTTISTFFDEFAPVGGILFPSRVSAIVDGGGGALPAKITLLIQRMEANPPIDDERFTPNGTKFR